jgi:hypothetical protein
VQWLVAGKARLIEVLLIKVPPRSIGLTNQKTPHTAAVLHNVQKGNI